MDNNVIRIDPRIDPTIEAYLGNKKEGDTVDMRLRGTVVSVESDAVTINIDEVVRLPEWKSGEESDSEEGSESGDDSGSNDEADSKGESGDDDDKSAPIMLVFGPSSKKKSSKR